MATPADQIVVTGASGFLGRHLLPFLVERYGRDYVMGLTSRDYNLLDPQAVRRLFKDHRPDVLVHLAAYSGGIGANRKFPADFYYRNTLLTALVFQAAAENGVKKMLYPMGGCSYPAKATSPIDEGQLWTGYPQAESAGYSTAKMMGTVASQAYRQQYGLNSVVIIPGNMYGEYDNFRTDEAHVIPAMVRRFYEAKRAATPEIVVWGTGKPARDFVYAGDVAATIPYFLEKYDSSEPVNVSSGTTTRIKDLAETIKALVDYQGEIVWDSSKPDGQMVKIFDPSRMQGLGLSCSTPLREGLKRTIAWFGQNCESQSDRIRL